VGKSVHSSPAIDLNGNVYAGSFDGNAYVFNSVGAFEWSYLTANILRSSPGLGSDAWQFLGSFDNNVYALTENGALGWSYLAGDNVHASPAIGSDGRIFVGSEDRSFYAFEGPPPTTPTPTPTPNYVDLHVTNGIDFSPGQQLILSWATHEQLFGFTGVPCQVFLVAAMDPPVEDGGFTVAQIVQSRALFIFNSRLQPVRFNPRSITPTFSGVSFPVPGLDSSGSLTFVVLAGAAGRWVFAIAFIRMDNGQFPAQPPVEVSNGFNLH